MNLTNSMISIALASMLVGCGSSNPPKKTPGETPTETPGGTPTPTPAISKVCLDVNMNALCDASETFKEVDAWDGNGDSKITVDSSLTGAALAYNGVNGYIFTAPADSTKIYAGTTMLNNELIYNQVIEEKTKEMAKGYVHPHFGTSPSAENKKDIADAVKSNIEAHPNESRYAVIAAVMNKLFAASTVPADIAGITVTAEDIVAADVPSLADLDITSNFDLNTTETIAELTTLGWLDAKDLDVRYLSSKNGKLIAGTKEHNGLVVVDLRAKTLSFQGVSVLTDAGHHDSSVSVDAASGASEPSMKDAKLTSDGSNVFFNVPSRGDKSNATIVGLFKTALAADGSIATTVGDLPNGDGTTIVAQGPRLNLVVSKFSLAPDDSKVIVYDDDKNLRLYDGDLSATALGQTDDTSVDALTAVAVSATAVYTTSSNSTEITKRAITGELEETGTVEIGFTPDEMIISSDSSKMVAFTYGHDHSGATNIALIDLATNALINSGTVTHKSDGATVSPDFTSLAIFGHEEDQTAIINLTVKGFSTQGRYDKKARNGTFIDNEKLALTDGKKNIYIVDIATTTDNNTLAEEMVLAKESITEKSINGGPLSVIIKDLNLNSSYGNIGIAWESTLATTGVLNTMTGVITRPENGAGDTTGGTLNSALTGAFRSEALTETVAFTGLNVRQMPKMIPASQMSSVATGRADYIAANTDGSVMVGPIRDAEDVYSMGSFKMNVNGAISIASTPFRLDENEIVRGAGIVGDYAIFTTSHKDENLSRIYSVAISADGTLATTITSEVVNAIPGAQPQKMEWTSDNTKAAVILRDGNKKYHAAIYNVGPDGMITTDKTFAFGGISVANHGPMVINDDATLVYQKDSSRKYVHAVNTTTGISDANVTGFPNSIARLWFAHGFLFEHDYEGNIVTLNPTTLEKLHTFHTGTGGRMYGGEGRIINDKNYYIIPVQQGGESVNGIYIFEVLATGELKEIAFANKPEGADRMAVSGDGLTVFFGFRDAAGERHIGIVRITAGDL